MYYGLYKNIRDSAWKCLLDFEIDSFPVDILKITRTAGIRVIKNSSVGDLMPGEDAKSYFNGHAWIVIYNDKNPVEVFSTTTGFCLKFSFPPRERPSSSHQPGDECSRE